MILQYDTMYTMYCIMKMVSRTSIIYMILPIVISLKYVSSMHSIYSKIKSLSILEIE